MIVLARIDDRLIHGQVVVGWVNEVKANHIVVVDDDISRDEDYKSLMEIAVPPTIKVSFFSIENGAAKLQNKEFEKDRIILLISNPYNLLCMVKKGLSIKTINVGGMRFSPGKIEILKSVFVNNRDISAFKELDNCGITIEGRVVPTDRMKDIISLLKQK